MLHSFRAIKRSSGGTRLRFKSGKGAVKRSFVNASRLGIGSFVMRSPFVRLTFLNVHWRSKNNGLKLSFRRRRCTRSAVRLRRW